MPIFFCLTRRHLPGSLDTGFGWSKIHVVDKLIREGRVELTRHLAANWHSSTYTRIHIQLVRREKNPARL